MKHFFNNKKIRKIIIVVLVITILVGVRKFVHKAVFGRREESHVSQTEIFTPKGIPKEYKLEFMGIDNYEHWIYKLNKEDQMLVSEDLQNSIWHKANQNDIESIEFITVDLLPFSFRNHECYVAYYDCNNEKFIDYSLVFGSEGYSTETIIYLYDTETHYYYCVYWTM